MMMGGGEVCEPEREAPEDAEAAHEHEFCWELERELELWGPDSVPLRGNAEGGGEGEQQDGREALQLFELGGVGR